ncbi:autotransporter assembly complex protein TamA [Roseateles toxinivorans]|uniref:Autotransporter secretion outer membrane protein TamA n=1 Tax=Roseateles toxinivorans TaxID=270368 RepID=A0A4R6QJT9_9BURK|nr:BamA/TamA family outer membrane protein [Roseateles toxinivorans]TDP63276.1 autotransporter secretion outer membrane protein TamA [Roseateles toxinivorans]
MRGGIRRMALAFSVVLASLASGCAWLPGQQKAAAEAASGAVLPTARAAYIVEVDAPSEQRQLLLSYLDLSRFQNAPQAEALSAIELNRLCAAAPAQARSLLETQGFFNSKVTLTRSPGTPERVQVHVETGEPARVDGVAYEVTGALDESGTQPGPQKALLDKLRKTWPLTAGRTFAQGPWSAAKNESLAQARAEGYPQARWVSTQAQVDAQANRVDIKLLLDSGPLYRLGALQIEGLERQEDSSVRRLAGFNAGEAYSEKTLLEFQERLQRAGLFDSVVVELDTAPEQAQAATVRVRVREAMLQEATTSVGYSANTGPRVALEHLHRRPLGFSLLAKQKLELGKEKRLYQAELTSHATPSLYRNQVVVVAQRLHTDDTIEDSYGLRVGRLQETPTHDRSYFVEALHGRSVKPGGVVSADASSINYHWTWRRLDSALLPTEGWAASAQLGTGLSRSTVAENGPFVRAWGRLSWYRPLGRQWLASARMEIGQVFAKNEVGLPDPLLFRAGGDDSVRGYAYRSLGPLKAGVVQSGRMVWTGSVEAARPIFSDLPQYQAAVFLDAGQAADNWGALKPVFGYGFGLRWRSPVGPLRVDLGWPEKSSKPRLHFSVGIAF